MSPPNVLLICTDHLSGLLTPSSRQTPVITPTIRQLGQNGVTFTNAYSACPSCIPARRTLMTGMTARSHGDRSFQEYLSFPQGPSLAQCFRNGGYQAFAVGKLHVYPQRNRIGFDDVLLEEQGRRHLEGRADDYELFLADRGYTGMEYASGMAHNDFLTRSWHLPEYCHPINWAAREMCRTIRRRDPGRPGFWYLSFSSPHPPLTPLQCYLDLYRDQEIDYPSSGDWSKDPQLLPYMLKTRNLNRSAMVGAPWNEQKTARRAFYATITHIDHQIRMVLGTLREEGLLDETILIFTSDHGHMIGEHGLWTMTPFYEMSAKIPLIIVPLQPDSVFPMGTIDNRLAELGDIMPTLLELCGLPTPKTVDGVSLLGQRRDHLYGEHSEGAEATRMIRHGRFKLIYYPTGNLRQLFDIEGDPRETRDLSPNPTYQGDLSRLTNLLIQNLYGEDMEWIDAGQLIGLQDRELIIQDNRGLMGQRGFRFL